MGSTETKRPIGAPAAERTARDYEIIYAIGRSGAGRILVARTQLGICAILIGPDAAALKHDLATRFPRQTRVLASALLFDEMRQVIAFIDDPRIELDLPLDTRHGTQFQQRVWQALRTIPRGTTESYTALARRIGEPKGARAVAAAFAANAIALAIPCHRVVRANGALSGYRWGVALKQTLLEREALA